METQTKTMLFKINFLKERRNKSLSLVKNQKMYNFVLQKKNYTFKNFTEHKWAKYVATDDCNMTQLASSALGFLPSPQSEAIL